MDTTNVLLLAACLLYLVGYAASMIWVYRDARRRGFNGWRAVAIISLLCWPASLPLWLLIRSGQTLNTEKNSPSGSGGWG